VLAPTRRPVRLAGSCQRAYNAVGLANWSP
jgi:hypothetical protein